MLEIGMCGDSWLFLFLEENDLQSQLANSMFF